LGKLLGGGGYGIVPEGQPEISRGRKPPVKPGNVARPGGAEEISP